MCRGVSEQKKEEPTNECQVSLTKSGKMLKKTAQKLLTAFNILIKYH